jgi:hypothetical protein
VNEDNIKHYFVDEAGDLTLFDKRGRIIVGCVGVSNFFMLGVADLPDPIHANVVLSKLRKQLLADPYFKGVPSMQPKSKKTAIHFHASKDLPEVRREVFKILTQIDVKIQVIIRRKMELALTARSAYQKYGKKFSPNDAYDDLVKRLFRNLLHKADENRIVIARRGKSPRLKALRNAIDKAKVNFQEKWDIQSESQITIQAAYPYQFAGLQIIDYYLWALQRLYEQQEDRFFDMLAPRFRMIMDIDDKRNKPYGEWYTDHNPLTVQKIKPSAG